MRCRGPWWLAPPLGVAGWLGVRGLADPLGASDAHAAMGDGGYGALHLCGACVLMLALLVLIVLGRPVLRLGLEHEVPLVPVRAPRPRPGRSDPLRLIVLGPTPSRPPMRGRGRVVRAPPAAPTPV